MDRMWKNAVRTAGAAGICAMLAAVLWEGINPQEQPLITQAGRKLRMKNVALPPEPAPGPQEAEETTITTRPSLMTFAPAAFLDLPLDVPLPPAAPSAPGPLIEEPDLPSNFV